jgi:TetR/AcrR family acrAB operon transcriptional repressor
MARRTKAEAERTRQRILKAALDSFVEKGYERTTFEDVARRIRLTKGAVYWHFKSKPALLSALVAHMLERHVAKLAEVAPPVEESLESLKAHFVARARFVVATQANRKFFHLMMRLDWPSAKMASLKQRVRQLESGPFYIIEHTLRELQEKGEVRPDVDVLEVRDVLGAMWLGLIKLEVGKCLDVDLGAAVGFGFEAVIARIRA